MRGEKHKFIQNIYRKTTWEYTT